MNDYRVILDTNIILYALQWNEEAYTIIAEKSIVISVITKIELLWYHKINQNEYMNIKELLNTFQVIPLDESITQWTIDIKRKYNTKTPDSIIAATAQMYDIPLVSADTWFKKIQEISFIPLIATRY